jgi:hypothetical protein
VFRIQPQSSLDAIPAEQSECHGRRTDLGTVSKRHNVRLCHRKVEVRGKKSPYRGRDLTNAEHSSFGRNQPFSKRLDKRT